MSCSTAGPDLIRIGRVYMVRGAFDLDSSRDQSVYEARRRIDGLPDCHRRIGHQSTFDSRRAGRKPLDRIDTVDCASTMVLEIIHAAFSIHFTSAV